MKKVIYLLLTLMFITVIFITYFVTTHILQSNFLFNHYHILEIDFDTSESENRLNEIANHLQQFSIENNININRYDFLSATAVDIYSTNIQADPHLRLRAGDFPEGVYYITNQPLTSGSFYSVGQLFFPGLNFDVHLYDFEQIYQVGLGGRLFLTGTQDTVATFIDEFSQYGQLTFQESLFPDSVAIFSWLQTLGFLYVYQLNFLLVQFRVMLVFMIVALIVIVYYVNQNRKQLLLEQLWGRSNMQATLFFLKDFAYFFMGLLIFLFCGLIIFAFVFHQEQFLSSYLSSLMLSVIVIFFLLFLVALIGISFAKKTNEMELNLKGKSFFFQLKGGAFLVKTSVYLLLWLSIASSLNTYQALSQQLSEFRNWEQTQNIFRTSLSPGRESTMHDLRAMRELNDRLFRFYQLMDLEHQAFTIYPHQIIHIEGVIINENYLDVNPIKDLNGLDIRDQLVQDKYTINLLVPEQFKHLENEIIEAYRNEFYFQKIYIQNMFNEEIGEPLIEGITMDDLSVYVIYTEEGQSYFSFNRFHGGQNNTFYDPIAVIFPLEHVDTSLVAALVANTLYFHAVSDEAFETISPAITESSAVEVNRVISIYDEVHQEVMLLQQQLLYQFIEVVLIITFSLLMLSLFIWAYYQTNSYQLNLKHLFGYSFWERHRLLILTTLFSNLIAGYLVVVIFNTDWATVWWFIGVFLVIDLILTKILSDYLSRKSVVRVLKGGSL